MGSGNQEDNIETVAAERAAATIDPAVAAKHRRYLRYILFAGVAVLIVAPYTVNPYRLHVFNILIVFDSFSRETLGCFCIGLERLS